MKPTIKPTLSIILAVAVLSLTTAVVSGDDDEPITTYTGTEEVLTQSVDDDAGDTAGEDSTDDDIASSVPSETILTEDSAAYSSGVQSGRCGENVTWTLEGGVLTISGEGEMYTDSRDWDGSWEKADVCSVVVEHGVTALNDNVFREHSNLTTVSLPDTLTEINYCAFCKCINLTYVFIPVGVTKIGDCAFIDCKQLTEINIPESVTSIGIFAFNGSEKLRSINIPKNVNFIGRATFVACDSLKEILVDEENQWFKSKDGVLYSKDGTYLYAYPVAKTDAHYTVPDGVTHIYQHAFYGNCNLETISLPDSLIDIEEEGFHGCENLISVSIPEGVTKINKGVFCGCKRLKYLSIPASVVEIERQMAFQECVNLSHIHIPMNSSPNEYMGRGNLPSDPSIYHPVNEYGCCEDENCPLNINRELKLEISPHSENDMWEKDFEYTNDTDGYVTNFGVSFRNGGQLADYAAMYIVYPDGTVELAEIHDGKIDQANSDMLLPALLEEQPGDIQAAKRAYRNIAPGQKVYGYLSTDDVDLF